MAYPAVDRSDFAPNMQGRMGDDVFDIGWAEGALQDGRPFRMECWGLAGSTGVTVFMASEGIEAFDATAVNALLEASRVITTIDAQELSLHHFTDPAGTPCVSISYIVADADDDYFVRAHPPLTSYTGNGVIGARLDAQETLDEIDALSHELEDDIVAMLFPPRKRSALAEARRAAKALAKAQPKKKRLKRRRFGRKDAGH